MIFDIETSTLGGISAQFRRRKESLLNQIGEEGFKEVLEAILPSSERIGWFRRHYGKRICREMLMNNPDLDGLSHENKHRYSHSKVYRHFKPSYTTTRDVVEDLLKQKEHQKAPEYSSR